MHASKAQHYQRGDLNPKEAQTGEGQSNNYSRKGGGFGNTRQTEINQKSHLSSGGYGHLQTSNM